MKTKLALLCAIIGICFCMTSCKSKIDSKMDKFQKKEAEYIAACNEHDFEKARQIVASMEHLSNEVIELLEEEINKTVNKENKEYNSWFTSESKLNDYRTEIKSLKAKKKKVDINNCLKYINDKEIYFLLAHNSRDNDNRIMYLYNSTDSIQLPDMKDVLEVAISQENENLATKLIKAGITPSDDAIKNVANNEMNDVLDLILDKYPNKIQIEEIEKYFVKEYGKEKLKSMLLKQWSTDDKSSNRDWILKTAKAYDLPEFQNLAKEYQDEKYKNQLKEIYDIKINARPSLGIVKGYQDEIPDEYKYYNWGVSSLNGKCIKLMQQAIEDGRPDIARKAFARMRPTLEWNNLGDWNNVTQHTTGYSSNYSALKVIENRDDINKAKKILNP